VSIGEFVLAIGIPWSDTDAKIVDVETGTREMQIGEVGELVVKGPQVMKGSCIIIS